MSSELLHVIACDRITFLLYDDQDLIVEINYILLFACFHLLAITNNAVINTVIQIQMQHINDILTNNNRPHLY